jgi:hypothetical protein
MAAPAAGPLQYLGWRARKRKVIRFLLSYQAAVLLVGSLTLSPGFASIVLPLGAFSMVVLAYATNHYGRDGDWEVIHIVFGANLRDIVGLMRSSQIGGLYGLTADDSRQLATLAGHPEAMKLVQDLFASHRIIDEEPSATTKRVIDIVLLLLGAIIGGIAQRQMAPPAGPHPAIWNINVHEFIRQESRVLVILAVIVASAIVLSLVGKRKAAAEHQLLVRYATERPLSLFADTFPVLPEVRRKIRDAVRWAARMSTVDTRSVEALEHVTGATIMVRKQHGSALGDIEWAIYLFNMGIVLGVTLPPMLGIG